MRAHRREIRCALDTPRDGVARHAVDAQGLERNRRSRSCQTAIREVGQDAQIDVAAADRGNLGSQAFGQRVDRVGAHRIADVGDDVNRDRPVVGRLHLDLACATAPRHHARLQPARQLEQPFALAL